MRIISFFILFCIVITGLFADNNKYLTKETRTTSTSTTNIICEIQKLESNRDPKCHATATRLENFMYGTKLTAETRFLKVKLQKKLLLHLWENVSRRIVSSPEQANCLA